MRKYLRHGLIARSHLWPSSMRRRKNALRTESLINKPAARSAFRNGTTSEIQRRIASRRSACRNGTERVILERPSYDENPCGTKIDSRLIGLMIVDIEWQLRVKVRIAVARSGITGYTTLRGSARARISRI